MYDLLLKFFSIQQLVFSLATIIFIVIAHANAELSLLRIKLENVCLNYQVE